MCVKSTIMKHMFSFHYPRTWIVAGTGQDTGKTQPSTQLGFRKQRNHVLYLLLANMLNPLRFPEVPSCITSACDIVS